VLNTLKIHVVRAGKFEKKNAGVCRCPPTLEKQMDVQLSDKPRMK
jgi:hypothetical protein